MITLRKCQDKQEWDDYVLENGGHPLQLWGWGDLKVANGWSADRLFALNEADEVIGSAQLLIRHLPAPLKSLSYIPRGPIINVADREEWLETLAQYAKKNYHSVALTIEPDSENFEVPQGWKHSKNHILPSRTIILDLAKTESELLNDMVKKTRQYIRKSASENIKIQRVRNNEDLDKCLEIYHNTSKRAKFNLHDNQYYHDVFNKLGDNAPLFAAYFEDKPIAFLWLAISANTAFELYGGVNETGQQLRSNYALKWYAIRKCKEWGLRRYDFGGLIEGGVTTFKMGWASAETNLAGTFDRPLSSAYGLWTNGLPTAKKVIQKLKSLFGHR
jgi:lipid II:glycine glycyltransferase (peptidoglycan interpeptide bridge formation enzyme)